MDNGAPSRDAHFPYVLLTGCNKKSAFYGAGSDGEDDSRWSMVPSRPRLAPCIEFRLSSLRVVIPGRESYERDLIRSLGEDIPDQVFIHSVTAVRGMVRRGAQGNTPQLLRNA